MAYIRKVQKRTYRPKANARKAKAPRKFTYVTKTRNLVKDVSMLKKMVKKSKPEVKYLDPQLAPNSYSFGQVMVNASGAVAFFLPTALSAGSAQGQRNGEVVTNIGLQIRAQIRQQSSNTKPGTVILEVFKTSDILGTVSDYIPLIYDPDTISGVIDYNSSRVAQNKKEYTRIFSRTLRFPADTYSGVIQLKDMKALIKRRDRLNYLGSGSTESNNCRYVCILRASVGNYGGAPSTITTIAEAGASTGWVCNIATKMYFTDV